MASGGRPLPKFGDWDVNNPASSEGFTVIFAKARDDKKTTGTAANAAGQPPPPRQSNNLPRPDENPSKAKKWLCCFP